MQNYCKRLAAWAAISILISIIFFKYLWQALPKLFSPEYVELEGGYPWFMLMLCFFWIYLKREELKLAITSAKAEPVYISSGFIIALIGIALSHRSIELEFLVFYWLLAVLGIFAVFFGAASNLPAALLGIYGFTAAFPLVIERFYGIPLSTAMIWIVTLLLNFTGITAEGQFIHIVGDFYVFVNAACAGSASITLFIGIFALMLLDIAVPLKTAGRLFLLGFAGTVAQNVIRLVIIVATGALYGEEALLVMHRYLGYIMYPAWFAIFAYIYLKEAKSVLK